PVLEPDRHDPVLAAHRGHLVRDLPGVRADLARTLAVHARSPAVAAMVRGGGNADRHDPGPARGTAGDHRLRRALEPRRRGDGGDLARSLLTAHAPAVV